MKSSHFIFFKFLRAIAINSLKMTLKAITLAEGIFLVKTHLNISHRGLMTYDYINIKVVKNLKK